MIKKITTILLLLAFALTANAGNAKKQASKEKTACQMIEKICIKDTDNTYYYFEGGDIYTDNPNDEVLGIGMLEYECKGNKLNCEADVFSGSIKIADNKLFITNEETGETVSKDIVPVPATIKKFLKEANSGTLMFRSY